MSASEMMMLEEELAELRAEVERLRGHRESCTANLLKGCETGKAEERAAVVAWLLERGHYTAEAYAGSIAVGLGR